MLRSVNIAILRFQLFSFQYFSISKVWQLDPIRDYGNGILQAVGADGLSFRSAERPQAGGTAQVRILKAPSGQLLLPPGVLQGPGVQHSVRSDHVWLSRGICPVLGRQRRILPKPGVIDNVGFTV